MQVIEIAVYFVIAILVAGVVVVALKMVDHERQYRDYLMAFRGVDDNIYKIKADDFSAELAKRWEDCRYGIDNMTVSVFVEDKATLDRKTVVSELLRVDKCDVIDCRNQTNSFVMETIQTPKIINIRCFNYSLIVR